MEIKEIISKKNKLNLSVCKHYNLNDDGWRQSVLLKLIEILDQSSSGINNNILYFLVSDYYIHMEHTLNNDETSGDITFDDNTLTLRENKTAQFDEFRSLLITPGHLTLFYNVDKASDDVDNIILMRKILLQFIKQINGTTDVNGNIIINQKTIGKFVHSSSFNSEFIIATMNIYFDSNVYKNHYGSAFDNFSGLYDISPDLDINTVKNELKQLFEQKFNNTQLIIPQ
jgi:hypothetical protein